MNKFTQLELNLNHAHPSAYSKHRIHIDGLYQWGTGWDEASRKIYSEQILSRLEKAGFTIEHSKHSGVSPTLRKDGSLCDVYLHPMEFVGIATDAEIDAIHDVLDQCEEEGYIDEWEVTEHQFLYDVTIEQYRDILELNRGKVVEWFKSNKEQLQGVFQGMEFVETCRPKNLLCFAQSAGFSSDDMDAVWAQAIYDELFPN